MNIFALMSQFNQFKKNPMGALQKTFNLPNNIATTDDALNYLMNSDKIPQDKKQQAIMMANMFRS